MVHTTNLKMQIEKVSILSRRVYYLNFKGATGGRVANRSLHSRPTYLYRESA